MENFTFVRCFRKNSVEYLVGVGLSGKMLQLIEIEDFRPFELAISVSDVCFRIIFQCEEILKAYSQSNFTEPIMLRFSLRFRRGIFGSVLGFVGHSQ